MKKNHKNYENYVDFTLPITIRFFPHWSVFNTRAVCIEQILVRWIRPSMLNFHFSLLLQRLFVFIFLRLHLKLCFVMTRWVHRQPNFNNFYRKREKTKQNEIYAATLTHEKVWQIYLFFFGTSSGYSNYFLVNSVPLKTSGVSILFFPSHLQFV